MYLSKLRINGFKSFANRVEVNFPSEGITSVVGPNGCGKSNIIDAIRWVLGEQRARALRSSKMEDVIFSGTADRPPMGLAEVNLIINNDSGILPSDYTQVMITRRAYRDGESEYLLNNQPCRLKDIHNLFYDTGMGAASYSLIEAKMIDTILSDKAEERRVLFEEAAGISKYKQQRKETLRQLERTSQDLARVEDSLRHVQQNVNLFERQAKKAEKWRELHKACRSLELSFQFDAFRRLAEGLDSLLLSQAGDENRIAELDAVRAAEEAGLEEEKLGLLAEEQALAAANQKVAGTQAEALRLESEGDRAKDRLEHLEESLRRLAAEMEEAGARAADRQRRRSESLAEAESLEGTLSRAAETASSNRVDVEAASARARAARESADALAEERMAASEALSLARRRLEAAEGEWRHLSAAEEELQAESSARSDLLAGQSRDREAAARELEQAESEAKQAAEGWEKALGAADDAGREAEAAKAKVQELEREKVAAETRRRILTDLESGGEGMEAGVKHLLAQTPGALSLLMDVVQVPGEWLRPVEKALGKSLQVVLSPDKEVGLRGLSDLRAAEMGEAFFGIADSGFRRLRPDLGRRPGFVGWLIDKLSCPDAWNGVLEWALGHHALADSLDTAFALAEACRGQDLWFWTPEGEAVHAGGLLAGGRPGAESAGGLLQRRAQLQETQRRLEALEAEIRQAGEAVTGAEARRAVFLAEAEACRARSRDAEEKARAGQLRLRLGEDRSADLRRELDQIRLKLESQAERKSALAGSLENLRDECARAEEERQTLENRFQAAVAGAQEREAERIRLEQEWLGLETGRAEAEARLQAARSQAEFLLRGAREAEEAVVRARAQAEEWESQCRQLRERIAAVSEEMARLHARLGAEEAERDAAKGVYDGKASGLEARRARIRRAQEDLRVLTEQSHQRSLQMEQAKSAMSAIRERMFELHEVDFSAEEPEIERVEYDPETAPERIAELKDKLKSLGNINAGAVEDYEAEKARLDEVQRQFEDLDKARQGLERAIKKLDKAARERFLETFAVVQRNFQEVFTSLFEGGEAQLALEDSADPLDARIEINARPTGKKMRGVSLLSGGERALTAISLLFALYLVRPSPYCILDEVDGPLDDANIGRFVNLLRRFSHQTQFIVVTHNKRTMAASDMLYGVTQEIKGISKLVAVQLDEAARIAA